MEVSYQEFDNHTETGTEQENTAMSTQDRMDEVMSECGIPTRKTITVLVWRHHNNGWSFDVVGTEERTVWVVASSQHEAEQLESDWFHHERKYAYDQAREENNAIAEGNDSCNPVRVYQREIWSELEEKTESLDSSDYHVVEIEVPTIIYGTNADYADMVEDLAREALGDKLVDD